MYIYNVRKIYLSDHKLYIIIGLCNNLSYTAKSELDFDRWEEFYIYIFTGATFRFHSCTMHFVH